MAARLQVNLFDKDLAVVKIKFMIIALHLNKKSREVCIKERSPLAFTGQDETRHTTVKWPI